MSPDRLHLQHYQDRRFKVFNRLGSQAACLVPSGQKVIRSGDTEYPFRQNSYLSYLSGWPEDQALLVLLAKGSTRKAIMFCQEPTDFEKRWVGERVGLSAAVSEFGFDEAFEIDELENRLPELLTGCESIYYPMDKTTGVPAIVEQTLHTIDTQKRKGWKKPVSHIDLGHLLDELRLIKMGDEIGSARKAASISAKAHARAMSKVKPGMYEHQVEAEYIHEFMIHGARDVAYTSIVAGGANACVLHYVQNNQAIADGSLVLVDAGCEYQGYAADITRTFPVNGKFSAPQKQVYEIVLASQEAAIEKAKAGIAWDQMQQAILQVLVPGLIDLGVLQGDVNDLIEQKAYQPYYMHNSGHWLGLDVHDVGAYKVDDKWRPLQSGMLLTIEPGLYFPPELDIPEPLKGIGVRIEDDILITDNAPDILTKEVPKTVDGIEQLMNS